MILLMIGTMEIIVIVLVVLLLFGGKKIPELMRGIGKGMRSFKEGMNGVEEITKESKDGKTAEDIATKKNEAKE